MGAVYRARNRVTGQLRAIKIIKPELAKRPDFVERFVREATIASQVRHPHLVHTYEPGIDGETIYLPMELLEGETLHARLRRDKRLSPKDTAAILEPVAQGVHALHEQRLVHRDLKPMNVFLTHGPSGEVIPKVLDFGTARLEQDEEHTTTGMVVGSPFYMAPEQAEGRRDIDGRVDQYALGVMAYQMVTGQRPYESDDTRSALAKLLRGDPYELPRRLFAGMPDVFEQVIVRMLAREREERFRTIVDAGRALQAAADAPVPALGFASVPPPPSLHAAPTAIRHSVPPSVPPPRMEAAGVPAHFTPGPTPPSIPAPAPSKPLGWVVAATALLTLGMITSVVVWQLTQPPEVTTTELAPRARPATIAPAIGVAPVAAPTSVPTTPIAPTLEAVPSPDEAPIEAPGPTPDEAASPAADEPREREENEEDGSDARRGSRETPERSASSTSSAERGASSSSSGSRERPTRSSGSASDPAPCGAATGIPCLE